MIFGKKAVRNVLLRYLMDFLVVFAGVYMAFLLGNLQQDKFNNKERKKILVALKEELEQFRIFTPKYATFQEEKVEEWTKSYQDGKYSGFNSWRYLEPQYNYRIMEYAMTREGTDIIDFELFQELQYVYNSIRRLEHAERLMTEFGNMREMNPSSDDSRNQNRFYFNKFIGYARDRASIQKSLVESSVDVLALVNERLSAETRKETEGQFVCKVLTFRDDQEVRDVLRKGFPEYSDKEWQKMLEACDKTTTESDSARTQ